MEQSITQRKAGPRRYLLGLAAVLAALFFLYIAWTYLALVYVAGAAIVGAVGIIGLINQSKSPAHYRHSYFVMREAMVQKHGRLLAIVNIIASLIITAATWPLAALMGGYLLLRTGGHRFVAVSSQVSPLIPAWLSPASFTLLGLTLILLFPGTGPSWLAADLLVASTLLILLHSCIFANMKEQALAQAGNPKLNYSISVVVHLVCAALARLVVLGTDAQQDSLFASIYSVLTFADFASIAAYGLTPGALANDLGVAFNTTNVPPHLWIAVALSILLYVGFLRFGLEVLSLNREDRHYLSLALSYAAIGDHSKASFLAAQARQSAIAKVLAAALKVRSGEYDQVARLTRRACELSGVPHSAEEEAVMALLLAGDVVPLEPKQAAHYLAAKLPTLANRHTATLVAVFALSPAQGSRGLQELSKSEGIGEDPFFRALREAERNDFDVMNQTLASLGEADLSPRLLRLLARAVAIFEANEKPDPTTAAEMLTAESGWLAEVSLESLPHWRLLLVAVTLHKVRTIHHGLYPREAPILGELQSKVWDLLRQSDLLGEAAEVIQRVHEREFQAAPKFFAAM